MPQFIVSFCGCQLKGVIIREQLIKEQSRIQAGSHLEAASEFYMPSAKCSETN